MFNLKKQILQNPIAKRSFSRFMKDEVQNEAPKKMFPWFSCMLTGASMMIYYCWQQWPHRKSRTSFVFCETNFYNLKQYQTILASPLSYENNLFFYCCLPGLFYTSVLIEGFLGAPTLIGAYLLNCLVSAGVTTIYHRQIGFHKVMQKGRISNSNGNMTLFLTSMFGVIAPSYAVIRGKTEMRSFPFYYLSLAYLILFLTDHVLDESLKGHKLAQQYNETHYVAVILGASLGLMIKFRKKGF